WVRLLRRLIPNATGTGTFSPGASPGSEARTTGDISVEKLNLGTDSDSSPQKSSRDPPSSPSSLSSPIQESTAPELPSETQETPGPALCSPVGPAPATALCAHAVRPHRRQQLRRGVHRGGPHTEPAPRRAAPHSRGAGSLPGLRLRGRGLL
ncbi:protein kinase N1, partial [Homo sapiens]